MKLKFDLSDVRCPVNVEADLTLSDVGLEFGPDGILAMVEFDGETEDKTLDFLIGWDSVLHWCMASSIEYQDVEIICQRLRAVVAKLQEWDESAGAASFKHAKIDRGDYP